MNNEPFQHIFMQSLTSLDIGNENFSSVVSTYLGKRAQTNCRYGLWFLVVYITLLYLNYILNANFQWCIDSCQYCQN